MKKTNLIFLISTAIFFTSTLVLIYLNYLKPQPSSPPTTNTIPTETPDPTTDWKTYENEEYGIEFKYPSNYSFEEHNPRPNEKGYWYISIMSPLDQQKTRGYTLNSKELKMEIYFEPQQANDSLDKFFNEQARTDGNPLGPYSDTIISGVTTMKLNWEGMGSGTSYYLLSGGNRIIITKYPQLTELDMEFSQILSTFNFTDTKQSELSWVNIDYPKYNLSFKIPKGWYFSNDAMNLSTQQINNSEIIDSFSNILFILDDPKSKNMLNILLDPTKPKSFDTQKIGDLIEFDQIVSSIKFSH